LTVFPAVGTCGRITMPLTDRSHDFLLRGCGDPPCISTCSGLWTSGGGTS
jgi:hypothetical protein